MGILDSLNPISSSSRAGRKMEKEALRWAYNRCKLNTPYYVREEIADRYKGHYVDSHPDGYVYFEYVFVRKSRIQKIPMTANGTSATRIYYYYGGEVSEKRPKNFLTAKQLKQLESRILRETNGFEFD